MQLTETLDDVNSTTKNNSEQNGFNDNLKVLVTALGGESNIVNITHCMTRLRFKLAD